MGTSRNAAVRQSKNREWKWAGRIASVSEADDSEVSDAAGLRRAGAATDSRTDD
jgi:hypothetical protein